MALNTLASCQLAAQQKLKGKCVNKVPDSVRKELAALAAKPDSAIDLSDLPATSAKDWLGAERGRFYRPVKLQLTVSNWLCG